jgi:hypothetical protein
MTFRTRLWAKVGEQARRDAVALFATMPAARPSPRVELAPLREAWGMDGIGGSIVHRLPWSMRGVKNHATLGLVGLLMKLVPNNERASRWSRAVADAQLCDIFDGQHRPVLWDDWHTDAGWARTFVQGPCAGDLRAEGDVWVVDASLLAKCEVKPGLVPLGVRVALAIDEHGPRPAWIQLQDGSRVTPADGDAWGHARLVAAAAMQNYVSLLRHVLNLHYIAGQALSVLIHNGLSWQHPLHRLLFPHATNTLTANWMANVIFMREQTLAEHTYALTFQGIQSLVREGFAAFRWADYDVPRVLRERGTEALVAQGRFPYGEDALLLWNTIDAYVGDYLAQYYADDAAIAADAELQRALVDLDAAVPEPLRATTRDELRLVLTRLIHMVSVEHKLVSGSVYDYFVHPYYFPTLAHPGKDAESTAPYREEAEQNLFFRRALSAVAWRLMADWTYVALDERGAGAMRRFQDGLRAAGQEIDARNARRRVSFPHLHPEGLESSTAL